jgi:ribosome-binding factor A
MESVRQSKVARLIQKELATFFQAQSRNLFPGKMITVTVVRISPDLGTAKVYLSIYPHGRDEHYIATVEKYAGLIRNALASAIRHQVRSIPTLAFYLDDSMDYLERINELLKS